MIRGPTLPSLVLLVSLRAAAAPAPPVQLLDIDLQYQAPPECPDRATFLARVQARRLSPHPDPRRFVVDIKPQPDGVGGVSGELRIEEAGAPRTIRLVAGATCDEVSLALALTTALALDEPPPAPAPASLPAPVRPGRTLGVRTGAQLAASSGVGPEVMLGVPIFLDLALRRSGSTSTPSARLSLEYAAGGGGAAGGRASFSWLLARLDLCPFEAVLTRAVRLVPCASFEGGILAARGLAVIDATDAHRPWLAPGVVLRLSWKLADDLSVELAADAVAPLIRDTFTIAPAETVHQVPAITFTASFGVALRLR